MVKFVKQIQDRFQEMEKTGKLFRVEMSGQKVWNLYLNSFLPENNPTFRDPDSSSYNCNNCKNFIRRYGNVVAIDDNFNIMTMFDVEAEEKYAQTTNMLSEAIRASKVCEIFFETYNELSSLPYEACKKTNSVFRLGIDKNTKRYTKEEAEKFGVVKENEDRTFNHFHLNISKAFVDMSGSSIDSIMAEYRDAKNVFQRAMETISLDTLRLVKDLINQGSLLDGQTHLFKIEKIVPLKTKYDKLVASKRDNWCWIASHKLPFAKFRNELIGVLCSELSEGEELNKACLNWNKRVDPASYMKATAPITKKQIEEAKKFVVDNGYEDSFDRRFANIDDIKISEILHANVGDGSIKTVSIFDNVKSASTRHKRSEFDKVEEVTIEKFMSDILPECTSIEAFLSNPQENNLVSLTTASKVTSKPIFKWDNNYSWTFNGNLAGKSQIKEAVKTAGGNVSGVLRASMIWNESNSDNSDLDLWCIQPDCSRIGFSTGYRKDRGNNFSSCGGQLDLDNTGPEGKIGIENIYFPNLNKMTDGEYKFYVNLFSERKSKGFKFEIEFNGELYSYVYDLPLRSNANVQIAIVTLKRGEFSIKHLLPPTDGVRVSKEIYGLETNQFHKVNLVCLSPNHWDKNNVGNKHYFFMLQDCKTSSTIRSFHNENLIPELAEHRKVLEALGNSSTIEPATKQLSGLGFNATVRDELIVKLAGSFKRVIKIKF